MIRTCDLCLRRAALYPLSYGRPGTQSSRAGQLPFPGNGAEWRIPHTIVLERDCDLEGHQWHIRVRRALLGLVSALSIAPLANVFGQQSDTARASSPTADLTITAPTSLRGGLPWQAQFEGSPDEVQWAVLEPSGAISFLEKRSS
jgi:hypothetical protein